MALSLLRGLHLLGDFGPCHGWQLGRLGRNFGPAQVASTRKDLPFQGAQCGVVVPDSASERLSDFYHLVGQFPDLAMELLAGSGNGARLLCDSFLVPADGG